MSKARTLLLPCLAALAAMTGAAHAGHAAQPAAAAQATSPARARSLFILHCAGCHQVDGSGRPQGGVPSMHNTLGWFLGSPEGRAFLVQVPGARNAAVTDAQLAAMTNWELQTYSKDILPAAFTPYTEAEVSAARKHPPEDITAARVRIIDALEAAGKLPAEAKAALSVYPPMTDHKQ